MAVVRVAKSRGGCAITIEALRDADSSGLLVYLNAPPGAQTAESSKYPKPFFRHPEPCEESSEMDGTETAWILRRAQDDSGVGSMPSKNRWLEPPLKPCD